MEDAVINFIEAIKASEEYQDYIRERERVKRYPDLKAQIDEYRRRNFVLQTSDDTAFEGLEQFEQEYGGLRENPMASDFLDAELAFCRLMQDTNIRVTEAIDFE